MIGDEHTYLPLDDLDANFQTANAVITPWPPFDVCISNPPYLGGRNMLSEKEPAEIAALRRAYPDIGGTSDYVSYWFRKAHDLLPEGGRAGLVGTANIRSGETRANTLDYIIDHGGTIYDSVSSQPWSGDATVEVSIVNWTKGQYDGPKTLWLSGGTAKLEVEHISGALSAEIDLRKARKLKVNQQPKVCFQGQTPQHTAGFVLTHQEAQELVRRNERNAQVIHPYLIGQELTGTGVPTRFIIDIPAEDNLTARSMAPDAYQGETWMLDSPEDVCAGQARFEYPVTSVLFSMNECAAWSCPTVKSWSAGRPSVTGDSLKPTRARGPIGNAATS